MFEELLSRVGECLSRHNFPYMIIGGQALLIYGEPRLTKDIDITLGLNTDHLQKLLAIAGEISLKPLPENIETFVNKTMVLPCIDESSGIRVDFIFSFTQYENQAIKKGRKIVIKDQDVVFASPEDVIIHKIFAGRSRDMEDVRSILIKNKDLDKKYIHKWLLEFNRSSDENRNYVNDFEEIVKTL